MCHLVAARTTVTTSLLVLLSVLPVVAAAVQAVPVWWGWMGAVSFCTYAYAGLVRNEFEGLRLMMPADAATLSAGGAAANTMTAATQHALHSAMAALAGTNATNETAAAAAHPQNIIAVDALAMVPPTVRVHVGTVQQIIALLVAFTVGSSILVVALTAAIVRWRYR